MLIAQITDIHLGFEPGNPAEYNRKRLDRILQRLASLTPLPELLLVTGDLADTGDDAAAYGRLRMAMSDCPFPVHYCIGNHDTRASFLDCFPGTPTADGFVQYAIEGGAVRILVLDTAEEGRHGGGFCETRAHWLRARLAEAPEQPTILVLHHPPIESGLSWMTERPDAPWVLRLEEIVAAQRNIVAMLTGHLHRPVVARWAGTALIVCPATAPHVALDLAALDVEQPDRRPMIVADPPGYALHHWNGRQLVTHFDTADDHVVLARFEPALQPMLRSIAEEKRAPAK